MTQTVTAKLRNYRSSAQKIRELVCLLKGRSVEKALDNLVYCQRKGAIMLKKLLESSIANAENNLGLDIDELIVSKVVVDEGATLKRFRARAKGRGTRILKRTCHVMVELKNMEEE
ncbi:MAG: 50S ribosomal protein L22 [Legionellales bacterium]|nr:50S ribosomal protein L22 [Legionellales bacterium]OUX64314.1 MAG: 50S ribosomal protein L22 [Gammaproteobacteria bacterium TMED281]|tara:strand:- start:32 stop:379 length:348 start_codon:yes stop_codon:yes gene_type:complete